MAGNRGCPLSSQYPLAVKSAVRKIVQLLPVRPDKPTVGETGGTSH
jgi:hypothetical protein